MSRSAHLGQGIVMILYISVLKLGKGVWSAHHGLRVRTGTFPKSRIGRCVLRDSYNLPTEQCFCYNAVG